jgi:lipopolysaccharide transport system ATP-binding protein
VLAVGDAEFQKKCLGKMQDVAGHGRTVLFVSHNMAAVASLCSKALLLEGGQVTGFTYVDDIISSYTKRTRTTKTREFHNLGDEHAQLLSITVNDSNGISHDEFRSDQQIHVSLLVRLLNKACRFRLGFRLDQDGVGTVFTTTETDGHPMRTREIGDYQFTCLIPPNLLSPGDYTITPAADMPMVAVLFQLTDAVSFTVSPVGAVGGAIPDGRRGIIRPRLDWQEQKASPVEPPIIAELHQ